MNRLLHHLRMAMRSRIIGNDVGHWSRLDTYQQSWRTRAAAAAELIPPASSILDLGCGQRQLQQYLPVGCRYVPADQIKWSEDVVIVDLNRGEFPAGDYDYVVLLGVMEYLYDPLAVLTRARKAATHLITSFFHSGPKGPMRQRRRKRWINDFTEAEFTDLLVQAGWFHQTVRILSQNKKAHQVLYFAQRS